LARSPFRTAVLASLLSFGCGGGNVDPGFYAAPAVDRPRPAHDPAAAAPTRFDRPKLVVIRADWCGVCHEIEPGLLVGYAPFESKVDLVVLDVSDARRMRQADALARAEGVGDFFDRYAGRTPTIGIFTRPEEARLVHGPVGSPAHIRRELEAALDRMREEQALGR
jgi:thiol-disulfide isomerase/thioredoxin